MRLPRWIPFLLLLLAAVTPATTIQAQTEEPTAEPTPESSGEAPLIPQIHVVAEGENLTFIAQVYGVTVEELLLINNLAAESLLYVGQELIIPGDEGDAIATVYSAVVGDNLQNIAARFNNTRESILEINRLIHPYYELTAGQSLTVVSRTGSSLPGSVAGTPHVVAPGETLLTIAAKYNLSPAELSAANELPFPAYLFPGQRLRIPGEATYRHLPGEWVDIQVRPWPLIQGSTLSIYVENLLEGQPSGTFGGQALQFVPHLDGYVALAGLDAFAETVPTLLALAGAGNRPWSPFRQELQVQAANYGQQRITIPPELTHLLAPEVRENEDAFLETIYTRFSETQRWEGLFQLPVTNTVVTAGYGAARSYNEGPFEIFHTGVDFGGTIGTPILAPANGIVVFSEPLELRGLTVIVDHGLGVMTAYFHLSETFVNVGDSVTVGQRLAAGGSSGLSSGPHLHWDLRIMNVPVNALQWTTERFP